MEAAVGELRGVPGRLERVSLAGPLAAFVDYAHNPDGLRAVLTTCRELVPAGGRLVLVMSTPINDPREQLGMGRVARELADVRVLTTERFLESTPVDPPAPLLEGATGRGTSKVRGRQAAIARGLELAGPNDVLLVTGRGAGSGPLFELDEGEQGPFDDREQLRRAARA